MSFASAGGPSGKPDADKDIDFGFSRVRLGEKQGLVDDVFHKVASNTT